MNGIGNISWLGTFAFIDGVHWMGMKSYDNFIHGVFCLKLVTVVNCLVGA